MPFSFGFCNTSSPVVEGKLLHIEKTFFWNSSDWANNGISEKFNLSAVTDFCCRKEKKLVAAVISLESQETKSLDTVRDYINRS